MPQLYVFAKTCFQVRVPGHEDSECEDGGEEEEYPRWRKMASHESGFGEGRSSGGWERKE